MEKTNPKYMSCPKNGRTWRHRKKRRHCVSCDNSIVSCPVLINLSKWLKSKQGRHSSNTRLRPSVFASTGRGLMSTKGLKCGDLVVSIPKNALVTCNSILKDKQMGGILRASGIKLKAMEILTVFLVYHRFFEGDSDLKPYIDSLPVDYTVPVYCSKSEIDSMPEFLKSQAQKQEEDIKNCFQNIYSILCSLFSTSGNPCVPSVLDIKWGWFTVNTRAVYLKSSESDPILADDDKYALAPYLDLLNHSHSAQVETGLNRFNGCYEIHTLVPYSPHEQVFINYGPHDNIKLYREYGFIIPNNPHNCVPFSIEDVLTDVQHFETDNQRKIFLYEKQQVLMSHGLDKNLGVSLEGPTWNLEVAVTIFLMTSEELNHWQMIYQDLQGVMHRLFVIQCLRKILLRKLNGWQSALENMEKIIDCTEAFDTGKKLVQECCDILTNTVIS